MSSTSTEYGLTVGFSIEQPWVCQCDAAYEAILPAPFGTVSVRVAGDRLTALGFLPPGTPLLPPSSPFLAWVADELTAYFADPTHEFRLPLAATGTAFRQRVWRALRAIPAGSVVTYGELARGLGSSARAVGQALGDNPLPIVVPCHRVVAADGGLGAILFR